MILLRHGQSEFNLHFGATRRDPGIIDPAPHRTRPHPGTEAATSWPASASTRIIVSPYTRALQTAPPVANALGLPVLSIRSCVSATPSPAISARPRAELERDWPDTTFSHRGRLVAGRARSRMHRGRSGRAVPRRTGPCRIGPDTLVISHWGFILSLTGQSVDNGQWLRCDPTEPAPGTDGLARLTDGAKQCGAARPSVLPAAPHAGRSRAHPQ